MNEENAPDPERELRPIEDRLREEEAILRRAAEDLARRRAQSQEQFEPGMLVSTSGEDPFQLVAKSLENDPPDTRSGTTRTLFKLDAPRATVLFNRALRESTNERRREIGAALSASGLATDAINASETPDHPYKAFALLCLLAKAGEVWPLLRVIEGHPRIDLRVAVVKLLKQSGEADIVPVFRDLSASSMLPDEVRSEIVEAIYRMDASP